MEILNNNHEHHSVKTGDYLLATRKGFEFGSTEQKHECLEGKKQKVLDSMEDKEIPPYKTVLAFGALGVSVVLGFINAENIKQSFGGIGFGDDAALAAGCAFTCIGLLIGERMHDGLKTDEFSGKKRPTGKFWGAACGAVLYLGTQAFLSLSAGDGASADMKSTITFTFFFSMLISLIELACGFLFLKVALQTISVLALNMRLALSRRRLTSLAYHTEMLWQRYVFAVTKAGLQPASPTEAVNRARAFYNNGGFTNHQFSHD